MTKAPIVKVAELNPNCEGCMAASRRMTTQADLIGIAKKKIRQQATEIEGLKAGKDREFTEEEKTVFEDMLDDHDPDLEKWLPRYIEAIGTLKKKILGE